jgi:predicted alpha/beta-fold hydrolase
MLINSKFRPPWWLRNPHAQTLWAAKVMRMPTPALYRERLTTPDNDFIDLDWSDPSHTTSPPAITHTCHPSGNLNHDSGNTSIKTAPNTTADTTSTAPTNILSKPVVLIFHGLTGSSSSPYVRALVACLNRLGYRSVTMNFRGCSGEPNLKAESYHSGHTKDISFLIDTVNTRFPHAPLAATGFSLGGNALLKYLATHIDNPLHHAISVSPPLQLEEGAKRMQSGLSRIYQNRLVGQLKTSLDEKHRRYPQLGIDKIDYQDTITFREFDSVATVPLHGFNDVDHYYQQASTLADLPFITTDTHILFARDDPFFTKECIPAAGGMSDQVTFELSSHGGHVAFVSGLFPPLSGSWLATRLGELHLSKFEPDRLAAC